MRQSQGQTWGRAGLELWRVPWAVTEQAVLTGIPSPGVLLQSPYVPHSRMESTPPSVPSFVLTPAPDSSHQTTPYSLNSPPFSSAHQERDICHQPAGLGSRAVPTLGEQETSSPQSISACCFLQHHKALCRGPAPLCVPCRAPPSTSDTPRWHVPVTSHGSSVGSSVQHLNSTRPSQSQQ